MASNQRRPAGESPGWLDAQVNCWAGVARKQ
ncbi:hypothetical protein [Nocardia sp. NPDC019395]